MNEPVPVEKNTQEVQGVFIPLTKKEQKALAEKLSALYVLKNKASLETLIKRALRDTVKQARKVIRLKKRRPPQEEEVLMEKRYMTSAGKFIPLGQMDPSHIFNAVRKMERTSKFLRDADGKHFRDADDAYPSTERFAGYADLVKMLKVHNDARTELDAPAGKDHP
jgi:hypothetical protein